MSQLYSSGEEHWLSVELDLALRAAAKRARVPPEFIIYGGRAAQLAFGGDGLPGVSVRRAQNPAIKVSELETGRVIFEERNFDMLPPEFFPGDFGTIVVPAYVREDSR